MDLNVYVQTKISTNVLQFKYNYVALLPAHHQYCAYSGCLVNIFMSVYDCIQLVNAKHGLFSGCFQSFK